MTITEIFEELDTIYNQAWFDDAKKKFYNHPANKNKDESFSVTVIDEVNDQNELTRIITFEDFALGIRDNKFDYIHDDHENDKLEEAGLLPNGYPDMILPEGVHYISSDVYYPNPSLQDWHNKIIAKIDKSLSLITNLAEKELFIDAIDAIIKIHKESLRENKDRFDILSKILNNIYEYISDTSKEISELNTFIEDNEENKIHFNLDQADLAKVGRCATRR